MAYFNTCLKCGCNLDPGEKCDCEQEREKRIFDCLCSTEDCRQLAFDSYALSLFGQEIIEQRRE